MAAPAGLGRRRQRRHWRRPVAAGAVKARPGSAHRSCVAAPDQHGHTGASAQRAAAGCALSTIYWGKLVGGDAQVSGTPLQHRNRLAQAATPGEQPKPHLPLRGDRGLAAVTPVARQRPRWTVHEAERKAGGRTRAATELTRPRRNRRGIRRSGTGVRALEVWPAGSRRRYVKYRRRCRRRRPLGSSGGGEYPC